MTWYYIYDIATGRLISESSDVPAAVDAGMGVHERASRARHDEMWDPATQAHIARPQKILIDRLQELADDPEIQAVWQRLNAPQRQALRDRLGRLLGSFRYRPAGEDTDLL